MEENYEIISRKKANSIARYKSSLTYLVNYNLKYINKLIHERCNQGEFSVSISLSKINNTEDVIKETIDCLRTCHGYDVDIDFDTILNDKILLIEWY